MQREEPSPRRSETAIDRSVESMLATLRSPAWPQQESRRIDDGWRYPLVAGTGFRHEYDAQVARGKFEFYELGPGLCLAIVDMVTAQLFPRRHGAADYLVLSAILEGGTRINDRSGEGGELADGNCTVYGLEAGSEFETVCPPGKTVKWVSVFIERSRLFGLTGLKPEDLPARISHFLTHGGRLPYRNVLLSRAASLAATQIMDCRYQDGFRRAFLTAKSLELVCDILFTLSHEHVEEAVDGVLFCDRDYAKLQKAIELMKQDLETRPNVDELAAAVGLTRQKLQVGFRSICGDTVARIRDKWRMEHALKLVSTSSVPMIDIALCTGYEHAGSFSRAFKAAFGVSPAQLRRTSQQSALMCRAQRHDEPAAPR